jgi:hypothetical protein
MLTANAAVYSSHPVDHPERDTWTHFVITFDRSSFIAYKNGVRYRVSPLGTRPKLKDVPLWIGKANGLGRRHFKGLVDEVRIYNRPLTPVEIAAHYRQQAALKDKDAILFRRPGMRLQVVPEPGWVLAVVDYGLMPLPEKDCIVQASLRRPGSDRDVVTKSAAVDPQLQRATVTLDASALPAGTYDVRATVKDGRGKPVGESRDRPPSNGPASPRPSGR